MKTSVINYLEETSSRFPDKIAYKDSNEEISFHSLVNFGKRIGAKIARIIDRRNPVVIYMKKNIRNIECFYGAAYAGCFYIPIDDAMPIDRVRLILATVEPKVIIYDQFTEKKVSVLGYNDISFMFEEAIAEQIDHELIAERVFNTKTTDLLYVLFTSGSTGIPKGVTISHAAVIDFMEWMIEKYAMDENTSLCNQAPFYFDASVPDIYIPIACGATTYIPPKSFYTFSRKIIEYIIENTINTLIWVPSALCNVVDNKVFDFLVPDCVKRVIFCGEVMPCKYLNKWRKAVPDAKYVNMYGPTEATYACMYYDINKEFSDEDTLPIGKACENVEIQLMDEGRKVEPGEIGEICILGQCLSNGYYRDKERTNAAFCQNPENTGWNELMYCTGDLGIRGNDGIINFVGRKDFQIKKNGFRIELGEIENALRSDPKVENACCVFDDENKIICAVYSGSLNECEIDAAVKGKLQKYMVPDRYIKLDKLPSNLNGKVDRMMLKKMAFEKTVSSYEEG